MDAHYIPIMEAYDELEKEINELTDNMSIATEVSNATVTNVSKQPSAAQQQQQAQSNNNNQSTAAPSQEPQRHISNSATVAKTGDGADPVTNASSADDNRDSNKIGADPNKFMNIMNRIISIVSNIITKTHTNIRKNTMLLLRNHKTLDAEIQELTSRPPLQNVTVRNWAYDDAFFNNAIRVLKKTANDYHSALKSLYDQFEAVPTMDADASQRVDPETGRPAKREILDIRGQAPMHDDLIRYLCDATGVDQVPGTQEFMKIVRDTYRGGNAPQERTLTDGERNAAVSICMNFRKDMKVLNELTDRFATIANVFKAKCNKMIQIASDMDDANRKVVTKEMQKISKNLNSLCTLNKFYVTLFTERSVNAEMLVRAAYYQPDNNGQNQQQNTQPQQQEQQTNQQAQEQEPQQNQPQQQAPQEQPQQQQQ